MKTQLHLALSLFLLIFSVVASAAQPVPVPVRIDPATGLPQNAGAPPRIDPATGLPQSNLYDEWQKAKALMDQGQYEESLQAFTNYFEQSRSDPYQAGMRLFSIINWTELGRRYPKAKQALLELRDADAQKLLKGEGDFITFSEVQVIDFDTGNADASCTLFKEIEQRDEHLAGECYPMVENQLIQKGDYVTCRKYTGEPESRFQGFCNLYQMQLRNEANIEATEREIAQRTGRKIPRPPYSLDNTKNNFVSNARGLIEVLVGTGDRAEAEKIQREALAFLNDPRLETAVADAEAKISKHTLPSK